MRTDDNTMFEALESRTLFAAFTVTNLSDAGAGSLRAAIAGANAAGGADVVEFQPGLAGVVTLASALNITDALTINGPGAGTLTVSGNNATKVFEIALGINATIGGLTIANGRSAGGDGGNVLNSGTLTINNSTITGGDADSGGGIHSTGSLTLNGSTVSGNAGQIRGGGITNYGGSLAIVNSTISGNASPGGHGGGIANFGAMTMAGSAVTSNSASLSGGGVYSSGGLAVTTVDISNSSIIGNTAADGGGINNEANSSLTVSGATLRGNGANGFGGGVRTAASISVLDSTISGNFATHGAGVFGVAGPALGLTIVNSTLSGNTASGIGGGVFVSGSNALDMANSTVAFNSATVGGGIANSGTALLRSTIVAGNIGGELGGIGVDGGSANNLIQESASAGGLVDGVNGNLVGVDPLLGTLSSNGGLTRTHALSPGSPAIDNGSNALALTTDQRGAGYPRVRGTVDIGAVEYNIAPTAGSLTPSAPGIVRGAPLTLTADAVADADSPIAAVYFYRDANGNGLAESNELIGSDDSAIGGYTLVIASTLGMPVGAVTFLAVAVDIENATSAPVAASVTITNVAPTLGSVTPSAASVARGQAVTLTANTPLDLDGTVASVRFYLDVDDDGVADAGELIGTDSSGGDGFSLTHGVSLVQPLGSARFLAVAVDNDGGVSTVRSTTVTVVNAAPLVALLQRSADFVTRGQEVVLTAQGVGDTDGSVVRVDFYRDANGNGVADNGELIGSDSAGGDGFSVVFGASAGLPLGNANFLAVAVDNDGGLSGARSAIITFTNAAPTLGGLGGSGATFAQGDAFTLTALGGEDTDGGIASTRFYVDLDDDGVADPDELLGTDSDGSDGFSYTLTPPQSNALRIGSAKFFAVAVDNDGTSSGPAEVNAGVLFSVRSDQDAQIAGAADHEDDALVATVSTSGHVIVFEEGWSVVDVTAATGAPAAVGNAVIWVHPQLGLVFVAAPSANGLLLFTRGASGWTLRNLSTETGGAKLPTHGLTMFMSIGDIAVIAGLTDAGEIVAFKQASDPASADPQFEFVDISADLTSQGMATPTLTSLISYIPSWDAWHLAGIDANGRVQSVWINLNVPGFTKWRVDDLTTVTGAPSIQGQLAVTLTPWGGINLTGLDTSGNLLTTWWVPQFGGEWRVNNLTEQFGGAPLVAGRVSGYTTPWGGLNYVGMDSEARVIAYWWAPGLTDWNVSPLLPESVPSELRPTGALTSSSSDAGTLNVYGTAASGDVIRMWWQPAGAPVWTAEDLSAMAVRG